MIRAHHERWAFPLAVVLLGVCLFIPGIGRFGLWEPHEIRIAEQAKDVLEWSRERGFDPTAGGKHPERPPLTLWLMVKSIGVLGLSETGARLPFAFMALLGLLVTYFLGASLFGRRVGLIAAFVLACAPGYILQARQLLSDMFLVVPSILGVWGTVLLVWPEENRHTPRTIAWGMSLCIGGLGLGFLAGGALLGVVLPLGGAILGSLLAWDTLRGGRPPTEASLKGEAEGLAAQPLGAETSTIEQTQQPTKRENVEPEESPSNTPNPSPECRRREVEQEAPQQGISNPEKGHVEKGHVPPISLIPLFLLGAVAVLMAGLCLYHGLAATRYSPVIGAIPTKAQGGITWDYFLKQVGFAFFPMSAVAPFAFGRLIFAYDPRQGRRAFGKAVLVAWAILAFSLGTLFVWRYGQLRFPALPALALGVAVVIDEMLSENWNPEPLMGFGIALVAAIFARDLFLYPEYLATNHLLETVKWPTGVGLAPVFVALGLAFAAMVLGAFAIPTRFRIFQRIATFGVLGFTLVTAVTVEFVAIPALSKHFSQKVLFDKFKSLRQGGEPLASYRSGQGIGYYTRGQATELPSIAALLDYLRTEKRVFAVIPAEELGQIDQQARAGGVQYAVVDATSSRFLLISNQLGPGETDKNPLRALVRQTPPSPQYKVEADFDGKITLLGYDLPREITRGQRFTITLHFHVKAKPPAGYKIFIHFDGPGTRFNGDHPPLDGKFPTQLWSPGDYITDPYEMLAERATTPKGQYTIWMGFWPGGDGKRLPVLSGPSDGNNRVRLGTVMVK